MASVASQLIEKVTAHAQRDSLEDAREICVDGTYFPNNLRRIKICGLNSSGSEEFLKQGKEYCSYTQSGNALTN
jgi:hypothetical protein